MSKAYGKSAGEDLHCFAARKLMAYFFVSNYFSLTLETKECIDITFPITSFPQEKDPVFVVIKGNVIFSRKRKGIKFSSF